MRTVIFGAGGVGGYFGTKLAQAGADILFVARGDHLAAMQRDGLRLKSIHGDVHLPTVNAASTVPADFAPDLVLMCVKTWQLENAVNSLLPALQAGTIVLPLLNGVDAPAQLARSIGPERVMPGLCGIIAYLEKPGVVRHAAIDPFVTFGEMDNAKTQRVQRLLEFFQGADGLRATIADDIQSALWMKFLFITSTSGVGAVCAAPMGVVRSVPETRQLLEASMREICALAEAHGITLPDDAVVRTIRMVEAIPDDGTTSMQRDLLEGRRSELEAQVGAVVRLARESGVAVPVNEAIYAALKPRELRALDRLSFEI